MRTASPNTTAALVNAQHQGIAPRNYIWIVAKSFEDGTPQGFGFHDDIDTYDVTVIDGITNLPVIHTYYGDGSIKDIGRITLGLGLVVRRVSIDFSNIHLAVNNMVRGFNIKGAEVQIHRGILDPTTKQLVDNPMPFFVGKVSTAEPLRPGVGGEGGITIDCVGFADELTRTNPARISDEYQSLRSGDRIFRYVDIMGDVKVPWGTNGE